MTSARIWMLLGAAAAATACVPRREAPPPEQQQPTRVPPPPQPAPPPPPAPADWRDIPLTRGDWSYRNEGSAWQAVFGDPGAQPSFAVRCERAPRQVTLSRTGTTTGNMMTVRTSYAARNFPLSARAEPAGSVSAVVNANDRFLDGIAFSRGRFTVEVPGAPMLVLPAWPEPARVIEDCRT